MTMALADAVRWLEDHVLDVDRRAQTCVLRPTASETLRRFFSYIEQVLEATAGGSRTGWMQVELFEGVPWTEDVIGYLGPRTTALLRDAQQTLQPYNGWIGRWSDADR
jgi:hypothetical protein